jgi:hypothetical protein
VTKTTKITTSAKAVSISVKYNYSGAAADVAKIAKKYSSGGWLLQK